MKNRLLLLGSVTAAALSAAPASASFIGAFHENINPGDNTLFIFGNEGASGTITGLDGLNEIFTIAANGVFTKNFGSRGREMNSSGTTNNLSFSVESLDPISGLALNRASFTTDMTTLLDTDALGTRYRVLAYNETRSSQMSVTAVEDGTTVTVTSPVALGGGIAANTPTSVTLNAGESVFYQSSNDLTGAEIVSDRKVAVFAGNECTNVGSVSACDHLISQQFSSDNFDTEFRISENFGGGTDSDLVRVLTDTDSTEVFLNGVSQGIINAGEFVEIDNVGNGVITSSQPVTVGQFVRGQSGTRTTGDPAFAVIPSVDQQLDNYAYATPIGTDEFGENLLNIAIDDAIASSLTLNGSTVDINMFSLIDGILFGNVPITPGFGTISASDDFLVTISGFSNFDSYFTPIATAFSPGVSPPPPPPPNPNVIPLPAAGWLLLGALGGLLTLRKRKM